MGQLCQNNSAASGGGRPDQGYPYKIDLWDYQPNERHRRPSWWSKGWQKVKHKNHAK
jgi:hypothetical protein